MLNVHVLWSLHKVLIPRCSPLVRTLANLVLSIRSLSLAGKDIREFPVKPPLQIVDTNGAGDSFVGGKLIRSFFVELFKYFIVGFLAYLALGKSHDEAIQAGAYCAFECIQQSGCTYPEKPSFDPTTFVV